MADARWYIVHAYSNFEKKVASTIREHAAVIEEHKKWLPKVDVPPAPNSASRVLTYDRKTDEAVWEGTTVKRSDPIPQ